MTTRREYICNLCRMKLESGNGVVFGGCGEIRLVPPRDAENHLCLSCICALNAALERNTNGVVPDEALRGGAFDAS